MIMLLIVNKYIVELRPVFEWVQLWLVVEGLTTPKFFILSLPYLSVIVKIKDAPHFWCSSFSDLSKRQQRKLQLTFYNIFLKP